MSGSPRSTGKGRPWLGQTLLLARQQVTEGLRFWAISALIGVLPFLAPLLPSLSRYPAVDVRESLALILGLFFDAILLIVLGSGFLAQDLAERRMGFYFARPFASRALAAGKLMGAWAVVLVSQVLLFPALWLSAFREGLFLEPPRKLHTLPLSLRADANVLALLTDDLPAPLSWAGLVVGAALAVLILLLAIHTITLWLRARSVWLVVDGIALSICAVLVVSAQQRLVSMQALGTLVWLERAAFFLLLVALAAALWAQVRFGRTHLTNAHRSSSLTLWSILLVASLAIDGYSRFVVSPSLSEVVRLRHVEPSPVSPWMYLGGPTRWRGGAGAGFLLNYEEDRAWHVGGSEMGALWFVFSRDGSRAVWMRCERLSTPMGCEIWNKDLGDLEAPPEATGVRFDSAPGALNLSPDGRTLAVARKQVLEVLDLSSARLISSQRTAMHIEDLTFLSPYRLRLFGFLSGAPYYEDVARSVAEVDIEGGRFDVTWRSPDYLRTSRAHRREGVDLLFYQTLFPPGLTLVDLALGVAKFERPARLLNGARFLHDGRLVLVSHDASTRRLDVRVVSPEGEELLAFTRDGVLDFDLGSEWCFGRIWLALHLADTDGSVLAPEGLDVPLLDGWVLHSLEVATGKLEPVSEGLRSLPLERVRPTRYEAPIGSPATHLFVAGEGYLVRWDPESRLGTTVFRPAR